MAGAFQLWRMNDRGELQDDCRGSGPYDVMCWQAGPDDAVLPAGWVVLDDNLCPVLVGARRFEAGAQLEAVRD